MPNFSTYSIATILQRIEDKKSLSPSNRLLSMDPKYLHLSSYLADQYLCEWPLFKQLHYLKNNSPTIPCYFISTLVTTQCLRKQTSDHAQKSICFQARFFVLVLTVCYLTNVSSKILKSAFLTRN